MKEAIGVAGATITAGQALYKSTSDGKWYRSFANDQTTGRCHGIALSAGVTDRPFVVALPPDSDKLQDRYIDLGATLSVGKVYVTSASNLGGIRPIDDVSIDEYMTVIGVATAANRLRVRVINSDALTGAGVS